MFGLIIKWLQLVTVNSVTHSKRNAAWKPCSDLEEAEDQLSVLWFCCQVSDKRVSRHHGLLENLNGRLRLKPVRLSFCLPSSVLYVSIRTGPGSDGSRVDPSVVPLDPPEPMLPAAVAVRRAPSSAERLLVPSGTRGPVLPAAGSVPVPGGGRGGRRPHTQVRPRHYALGGVICVSCCEASCLWAPGIFYLSPD